MKAKAGMERKLCDMVLYSGTCILWFAQIKEVFELIKWKFVILYKNEVEDVSRFIWFIIHEMHQQIMSPCYLQKWKM